MAEVSTTEVSTAVDSSRDQAYVRKQLARAARHSSTSSDVERFGMTLEGFVPRAS
jgi:hypothetical protein